MYNAHYNILTFFAVIEYISSQETCVKFCNNNGICYKENGIEKCKCLDRIYIGESCETLVNYCDSNPCEHDGKCISTPGQYNCLCTEKYYGQNCSIEAEKNNKIYLGEIYLLYNHVAHVSGHNYFLIILRDLGTVTSKLEMLTSEYAIVGGLTSSDNSENFVKTNDIKAVAEKYKLPASSFLPSGTLFYYVGKYRMPVDGIALVTLTISEDEADVYYIWYFQFGSINTFGCNPVVKVSNCGAPKSPLPLKANKSFFVEANIQRDCGRDSMMSYTWSITNYFDTETLQSFNIDNSRSLKIPAYGIKIDDHSDDPFRFFKLIKLISLERSADGMRYGEVLNRCYIVISMKQPIAKISGGEHQEYSHAQEVLMDGSESVDLMLHPKIDQNLSYMWRCNSINGDDSFCENWNKTGMFNHTPH